MSLGMNLADGRKAPKSQWLAPGWTGYGARQGIFKTGCLGSPLMSAGGLGPCCPGLSCEKGGEGSQLIPMPGRL